MFYRFVQEGLLPITRQSQQEVLYFMGQLVTSDLRWNYVRGQGIVYWLYVLSKFLVII